jgi:hypothetical protein
MIPNLVFSSIFWSQYLPDFETKGGFPAKGGGFPGSNTPDCVGSLKNLMCVRPSILRPSVRPHHFWSIWDHVLSVICLPRWFLVVSERVRSVTHRLLSVFSVKIDIYWTETDSVLYVVTSLIRSQSYTKSPWLQKPVQLDYRSQIFEIMIALTSETRTAGLPITKFWNYGCLDFRNPYSWTTDHTFLKLWMPWL